MTGLVVVAHARLAEELVNAAVMVVGDIPLAEAVGIDPSDDVEKIRNAVASAIGKVSAGGAIVMTDMFGGTPSNMALSFLAEGSVEVLTGVNLPMILDFAMKRERMTV